MTPKKIDQLVMRTIKKEGITLQDMNGAKYINPSADGDPNKARWNKFKESSWADRTVELMAFVEKHLGEKITLQDIFRFWWNHFVDYDSVIEEALEDIFIHFKDKLLPPKEKDHDMMVDFDEFNLPETIIQKAA